LQKNAPAAAAAIIGTVLASLPAVGIATAWLGGQRTSPEFGNKLSVMFTDAIHRHVRAHTRTHTLSRTHTNMRRQRLTRVGAGVGAGVSVAWPLTIVPIRRYSHLLLCIHKPVESNVCKLHSV
jgi:hypothetical protein